jgi:hypothetical protein
MAKQHAKGLGYGPNDITHGKDGLNRVAFRKTMNTVEAADAWRKAKEEDPKLEFRMSFVDFKRIYFAKKHRTAQEKKLGKQKSKI